MNDIDLLEWCKQEAKTNPYIRFPKDILDSLEEGQAELIAGNFSRSTLMYLPASEIKFFEWLKVNDYEVWKDLWEDADAEPYVVGISFLPIVLDPSRGFPICDLLNTENYYFSEAHIAGEEAKMLLDSVKERFLAKEKLTVSQLLMLTISLNPTDIWHFAYKYNLPVETAKNAVHELSAENLLIHLKNAEQLALFIEF